MNRWTHEELAAVVAAAHAEALAAEVEVYLAAVAVFDAEGLSPFAAVREQAALERELAAPSTAPRPGLDAIAPTSTKSRPARFTLGDRARRRRR
jgi:hypothetical protein